MCGKNDKKRGFLRVISAKRRKKLKNPLKTFDKAVSVGYNYVAMMCHSAHFGHGLMSEIAAVKLADAADNSGGQVRTIRAVRQKSWKSKKSSF